MLRYASPIEWVPVAQAVTTLIHFPFAPKSIATFPAAMLDIIIGTSIGFTLSFPLVISFWASSSISPSPPIPEPILTPTL